MKNQTIKISAVCPELKLANVEQNTSVIIDEIKKAVQDGVELLVFPELTVCGYTCGELFAHDFFIQRCEKALKEIVAATKDTQTVVCVGAPVYLDGVYNCAFAIQNGKILCASAKSSLSAAFDEYKFFVNGEKINSKKVEILGDKVIFTNSSFKAKIGEKTAKISLRIGFEQSFKQAKSTQICVNLAAIPTKINGFDEMVLRSNKTSVFSGICVFVNAGLYESTSDALFGGEKVVSKGGKTVCIKEPFSEENATVEIELSKKKQFAINAEKIAYRKKPFLPNENTDENKFTEFVLDAAGYALAARMQRSGAKTALIGVSGGLDSTLALLIIERAFDLMGRDKKDIIAITMPGFGTTGKTYKNSLTLMDCIGATVREVDITKSVLQHFEDIGHDKAEHSVTYENAQARTRTMILMNVANKTGGLVVGTGDLSEIALGWSTYNGDHMSMYAVNASLPKTLIRYLVGVIAKNSTGEKARVLSEIYHQEISPELLPPSKDDKIEQKTEDLVGPYELHDFFLYYFIKYSKSPKELYAMAKDTFKGEYSDEVILKWLKVFFKRFTTQQFKRSCAPDGAAIGEVCISTRVYRMPSDLPYDVYLKELDNL